MPTIAMVHAEMDTVMEHLAFANLDGKVSNAMHNIVPITAMIMVNALMAHVFATMTTLEETAL